MGVGGSLLNLGIIARDLGEYDRARGLVEQALEVFRPLGHPWNTSAAVELLGEIAQRQADYARAVALHDEALALRREMGPNPGIVRSLNNLGLVAGYQGDLARATARHREALMLLRDSGEPGERRRGAGRPGGDRLRARAAGASGAAVGAAEALREAIRAPLPPADHAENERLVAAVRAALTQPRLRQRGPRGARSPSPRRSPPRWRMPAPGRLSGKGIAVGAVEQGFPKADCRTPERAGTS